MRVADGEGTNHMLNIVLLPAAIGLLVGLTLQACEAAAVNWPLLTYPPGSTTAPLGQYLRHNGYQMQITRFRVNQPIEQVMQFFQSSWRSSKPKRAVLDGWQILTKKEGPFISTVEIRPERRNLTQGVSATRFLQDVHPLEQGVPKDIPIVDGAVISSLLESEDLGRKAVTIMLLARVAPLAVHKFYLEQLAQRGWETRESDTTGANGTVKTVFIAKADRGGMVQTMHIGGMTQSVIHIDHGK